MERKTIHLTAIGGAVMHNLALALQALGHKVTGSDDEIFDPAHSRLKKAGLLPDKPGWFAEKIHPGIDYVILGMHAREDNPELLKARELNIQVYSFPEYMYLHSKEKKRAVIGGSHGKTTITSMIMHVLKESSRDFDYLVGAQVDGFETMVSISEKADIAVFEGDEYLASPVDRRPKFHLYHPHVALISGVAWDHINVFPTLENYISQFAQFITLIEPGGCLIYFDGDPVLCNLASQAPPGIRCIPYAAHPARTTHGTTELETPNGWIPLQIFGDHNLQNLNAARLVCQELGIPENQFYASIATFRGAARRLQLLASGPKTKVFLDFAHAPSKLKASLKAVKKQFPEMKLVACMELHTFSSLNPDFLSQYAGSMDDADEAIVYFNPHTLAHKKLPPLEVEQVRMAFQNSELRVFNNSENLQKELLSKNWQDHNLLMMTSGNFDGIDFHIFSKQILDQTD